MIELVQSPLTRVLSKGRLVAWLVVSLVFAALLLAGASQARGANVPERAAAGPSGEAEAQGDASPEQGPPSTGHATSAPEEAAPTAEEAPHVAEEAAASVEEAPPVAEKVDAPVEEAPPVAEQAPQSVEGAPRTTEQTVPTVEETNVEQATGDVTAEQGLEDPAIEQAGVEPQVPVAAPGAGRELAAGELAAEASIAPMTSAADASSEISTSAVQDRPSLASCTRELSACLAGQASCELGAIGPPIAADCAGDWWEIPIAPSVSTKPFASADASLTATTADAADGSKDGGASAQNHPSTPIPGPPPGGPGGSGGAGGGAAAGGGSGFASSAFSTRAGLLLQAAPRAMRRLRLAQSSWRTSFFVLIPERPD